MELVLTLHTKSPKQQKSLLKEFLKVPNLSITRGIVTGKLMDIFVEKTVTASGWIKTLNVKRSNHLAGLLS